MLYFFAPGSDVSSCVPRGRGVLAPNESIADDGARPLDGRPFPPPARVRDHTEQTRPGAGVHRQAFTLLELLTVLAIIAVLTGLVLGGGRRANEAGKVARARSELAQLAAALGNYQLVHGDYPQTRDPARLIQSLLGRLGPRGDALVSRSLIEAARFSFADGRDPRADSAAVLVDPWGQPYRYGYRTEIPWSNAEYVLFSTGPDGRDSGTLLRGGFPDSGPPENLDNLYANSIQ